MECRLTGLNQRDRESTALRRRLPLAARSAVDHMRRQPPSATISPWTRSMTVIAFLALLVSVGVAIAFDPYAVEFVRSNWRTLHLRWLASITDLGKSEFYLMPAAVAVLLAALADWTSHGRRAKARLSHLLGQSAFIFGAVAVSGLAVNVVKLFVGRARPILFDELGPFAFRPFEFTYDFLSYPSGHSTTAGAVTLALMLLLPRLRAVALILGGLVAISRVAALAHYPGDVVAGFAFGFLVSLWFARWLAARRVVFRVVGGSLLPIPRHRLAWRRLGRAH